MQIWQCIIPRKTEEDRMTVDSDLVRSAVNIK